ncbi:biotin/lipoyl-binding protein [Diaminobutyricibacter tongyongensis]|uniref:Biotin/lipoyl-binding protein n=1 Tax=Leifsonia tongyongensis TaxID=1268043 RepID=A0A6L9XTN1_9MICO|nr:HlyD family efflux transporter periplasmic adaptor subunit [Diaminobutyricibacter tongyongensis]NEN04617.1 biotin/lipoyl-binding protein [Diaminobutyricibacter tongyongensis]
MTWANRFKLLLGLIVVVALVATFTLVFNQRQQQATSTSATIGAQSYPVGTDYGGIVTRQYVQDGDTVQKGQKLFDVQSLRLQQDVAAGTISATSAAYPVSRDGTATLVATVSGRIASIDVEQGAFAQAGAVLAHIDRSDSLYVKANFTLTPRDYARISDGASVQILLPNQRTVQGTVGTIEVQTVNGSAQSTIHVVSSQLVEGSDNGLVAPGTPVVATLHLRDDGILSGPSDAFAELLRKIGL